MELFLKYGWKPERLFGGPRIMAVLQDHFNYEQDKLDALLYETARPSHPPYPRSNDILLFPDTDSLNVLLERGANPNRIWPEKICVSLSQDLEPHEYNENVACAQYYNLVQLDKSITCSMNGAYTKKLEIDGLPDQIEETINVNAMLYLPLKTIEYCQDHGIELDYHWMKHNYPVKYRDYRIRHQKLLVTLLYARKHDLDSEDELWNLVKYLPTWIIRQVFEF